MTQHLSALRQSVTARYLAGILIILAISLGIFNLLMHPPLDEIGLLAVFLSVTAVISALVGYGSYRMGWMERSPTIRWTLLGGYALSSVLTFINIWLPYRLMYASEHDLLLATVLLVFAGGMAMALGYFLSSTLTDRIRRLEEAAEVLAGGDLSVRVPVYGRDEMADLAHTFNQMAERLQAADRKQRELETLRRDLIAWSGHDLQTPLASIRAIVEALADGVVEDAETRQRYLRTAQKDIRSLSLLVDDLFEMAQLDAGGLPLDLAPNSLADLISDALESFSELAARRGVTLRGHAEPGIDPVLMDAQRIGRVLDNLLSNALRHTPDGGQVSVYARSDGDSVRVEVEDNGLGVSPDDLPHLFERFYRGEKSRSRSTGGAGLGLAIARGIVEAHGGQIGVESAAGRTCFHFTLPAGAADGGKIDPTEA